MQQRDYYKRTIIGEIDGSSVYGQYYDDDRAPSVVGINWNGWWIESDGAGLWFSTTGHSVRHMSVSDWARVKELAQTDVIERLIEMGRQWVTSPPLKS
jgi:hypothetical protein